MWSQLARLQVDVLSQGTEPGLDPGIAQLWGREGSGLRLKKEEGLRYTRILNSSIGLGLQEQSLNSRDSSLATLSVFLNRPLHSTQVWDAWDPPSEILDVARACQVRAWLSHPVATKSRCKKPELPICSPGVGLPGLTIGLTIGKVGGPRQGIPRWSCYRIQCLKSNLLHWGMCNHIFWSFILLLEFRVAPETKACWVRWTN